VSQARILILSSRFGEGHYQAGEALVQKINVQAPAKAAVSHLDFGSFFYRKTDYLMRAAYLNMVTKTPEIWRLIYDKTIDSTLGGWWKFVYGMGSGDLLNHIREFAYDLVVCTHFIPAGILAEYKRKGQLDVPLVTVITDYLVHGVWIYPEVDLYMVGCREAVARLQKAGIKKDKILLTGIPVRAGFFSKLSKEESRQQLGLQEDKKTVLVMGGSSGLGGKEFEILDSLLSLAKHRPVQLLFVCGSNQELYLQLKNRIERDTCIEARVFGYVHNIPQLMAASDLLITKGGALTISEALTIGLPVVMYKPIPGHENGNAAFVVKSNAGLKVTSPQELGSLVKELLTNESKLEEMSVAARRLLPPQAASAAAESILELASKAPRGCKNKEIV
jgi:processive 1,2-diacylglycerol beta-glucosyltransferase